MKFREFVIEASPAAIKRALKAINKLNDKVEQAREAGQSPKAADVKELGRLESAFLASYGTSFDEYEKQQLAGDRRPAEEMVEIIKTINFEQGTSENLIAAEVGEEDFYRHILRDVATQLPDDIANALIKYLDGSGDPDDYVLANAVVNRAIQLGVVDAYRHKQVEKLDKGKMNFSAYDDEEPNEQDDFKF